MLRRSLGLQRLSSGPRKDRLDNTGNGIHALIPLRLGIDIQRDVGARVTHVVPRDFSACSGTPHQAGMHRAEAPEIDR